MYCKIIGIDFQLEIILLIISAKYCRLELSDHTTIYTFISKIIKSVYNFYYAGNAEGVELLKFGDVDEVLSDPCANSPFLHAWYFKYPEYP